MCGVCVIHGSLVVGGRLVCPLQLVPALADAPDVFPVLHAFAFSVFQLRLRRLRSSDRHSLHHVVASKLVPFVCSLGWFSGDRGCRSALAELTWAPSLSSLFLRWMPCTCFGRSFYKEEVVLRYPSRAQGKQNTTNFGCKAKAKETLSQIAT